MALVLTPLKGMPLISEGDDLSAIILTGLAKTDLRLRDGDILAIGQKIVSKAEGRFADLASVVPSAAARRYARVTGKDPRLVELILNESRRVLRTRYGTMIVEHRLGFVCANAGIDHSNVGPAGQEGRKHVLLLPIDPDMSAVRIRISVKASTGSNVGVLINDSHGRAWRLGTVGSCIGVSGIPSLMDQRGWTDLFGSQLHATVVGAADELAAAASLVMGQAAESTPVIHVRGFPYRLGEGSARRLLRPTSQDLFR